VQSATVRGSRAKNRTKWPISSSASQKKTTEKRNKPARLGLLAGLVLAGDTLEQKDEGKSRDAIESGKVIGDQTAKTKALNGQHHRHKSV